MGSLLKEMYTDECNRDTQTKIISATHSPLFPREHKASDKAGSKEEACLQIKNRCGC
jgi:hypothetical protein